MFQVNKSIISSKKGKPIKTLQYTLHPPVGKHPWKNIKRFSWTKIAKSIGYAGNADYVRLHIRDKYLKKQGIN